jgi:hypothetical protein
MSKKRLERDEEKAVIDLYPISRTGKNQLGG